MESSIFTTFLDIFITGCFIYTLYYFLRGTYTASIIKGLIVAIFVFLLLEMFNLRTLSWIFRRFFNDLPITLAIIFQKEIRRFLSTLGRNRHSVPLKNQFISQVALSLKKLAKDKIGGLIIIEGQLSLSDIMEFGVPLHADFSPALIQSIFYPGTMLHDGAVVIQNEKIIAAQVFLPTTFANNATGTRHAAGTAITQDRDCVSLIVSEETGSISYAKQGILVPITTENIEEVLLEILA
ncbi:MAG: diadenylate cyclase CdaA [Brevinemataceae bacterium]